VEESRTAVLTAVVLQEEYALNLHSIGSAFCVNRLPVPRQCKLIVFLFGSFLVVIPANPPTLVLESERW
jgi:hypothetical protein